MLRALLVVWIGFCWAAGPRAQAETAEPLRIITWNVLNGFGNGRTLDRAVEWLSGESPDVVALQELTGHDEERLAAAAARWGHQHSALSKVGGYPVGLTSKAPIEVVEKRTAGLHHGYLHARTAGLDVVVVHLHPGSWEFRVKEAAILAELAEGILAAKRPLVMLGDFNAHAAIDRRRLATRGPLLARRAEGGGGNRRGEGFDHEAMETILATGLTDVCVDRLGGTAAYEGTFPTRYLEHTRTVEAQQGFLERIDYVLLDARSARRCMRAVIHRGELLDAVSDHYPVSVELQPDPLPVVGLPIAWTHGTEQIRGFSVHVARKLRARSPDLADRALEELDHQLRNITRMVPDGPLAKLREIPLWVSAESRTTCMAYHPSRRWLATNEGHDPRMARAVEIGNPATFLAWTRHTQPWMVLHELAHGYHHRVLGFDHAGIRDAHAGAREDERYANTLYIEGGRKAHYALTTPQEWFAEMSEAWFGTNDFHPFVRGELQDFDPEAAELLRTIWR